MRWELRDGDFRMTRPPHGELSTMTPEELIQARAALGLTLAAMGERLGITTTEVWRKVRGHRPITQVQSVAVRGLLLEVAVRKFTKHEPSELVSRLLSKA